MQAEGLNQEHPQVGDVLAPSSPIGAAGESAPELMVEPSVAPTSDAEVARALLSFGETGIGLWNGRRKRHPGKLELERLDLSGLNVSGADLSNCSLRNANFTKAVLYGCHFDASDLTGARLTSAKLEGSSFKQARLLSATLTRASLRWCDFSGADLRNADVEDAELDPCSLSGSDLTGAHFSGQRLDALREGLRTLESAGEHPRHVFFSLIGLCVVSILISVSTPDLDLIMSLGHIRVPVLDSDISPRGFFFVVPIAFAVLTSYIAIHLKQLEAAARELPARFPDGTTLAEKLTPWMKNVAPARIEIRAVLEDGSDSSWSVPALSERLLITCTRWIVPVCSALILAAYCRSRRPYDCAIIAVIVLGSWFVNHAVWRPVRGRPNDLSRDRRFLLALLVAASAIGVVTFFIGPLQAPNKDFEAQSLSHVRLKNAELRFADLSRVIFDHVDLRGAQLLGATLKQSGGQQVTFYRARLNRADLTNSFFKSSDFSEGQFIDLKASDSVFQDTSFRGSDLSGADLSRTRFECVDVRGVDLSTAKLADAHVHELWCDTATKMPIGPDGARLKAECDEPAQQASTCRARLAAALTSSWR